MKIILTFPIVVLLYQILFDGYKTLADWHKMQKGELLDMNACFYVARDLTPLEMNYNIIFEVVYFMLFFFGKLYTWGILIWFAFNYSIVISIFAIISHIIFQICLGMIGSQNGIATDNPSKFFKIYAIPYQGRMVQFYLFGIPCRILSILIFPIYILIFTSLVLK